MKCQLGVRNMTLFMTFILWTISAHYLKSTEDKKQENKESMKCQKYYLIHDNIQNIYFLNNFLTLFKKYRRQKHEC